MHDSSDLRVSSQIITVDHRDPENVTPLVKFLFKRGVNSGKGRISEADELRELADKINILIDRQG
jgi:hypothetical protein